MARDTQRSSPLPSQPSHRYVEALEKIIHRDFFPDRMPEIMERAQQKSTTRHQAAAKGRAPKGAGGAKAKTARSAGATAGQGRPAVAPGSQKKKTN